MLLLGSVLILMNLERTLRSAVGTGRWRIKFLVLGLGVIFGVRIYTRSQALLYSGNMLALGSVETGALLLGCLLMGTAYFRRGFGEVDVYPSRAVLHTSLTVLLTGSYLLIVGLLAQIVARLGGPSNFALSGFSSFDRNRRPGDSSAFRKGSAAYASVREPKFQTATT